MRDYLYDGLAGVFQPHEIELLSKALNEAWKTVLDSGAYIDGNAERVRGSLATYIIEAAVAGERDRRKLCDGALALLARRRGL